MTADAYARLDAAYLLGALEADERVAYEAHLATCSGCQASLADVSVIPPLLAGLDESAFAAPIEPVPDKPLLRVLQTAARERGRRRRLTVGLGLLAAACAIALIVVLGSATSRQKPASWTMRALVATPVHASIALQPRPWGTEVDLTCWSQRGPAEPPGDRYQLVAHGADGSVYDLGSWRLVAGRTVTFTSGIALSEIQISDLQITQSDGPAILGLAVRRLVQAEAAR